MFCGSFPSLQQETRQTNKHQNKNAKAATTSQRSDESSEFQQSPTRQEKKKKKKRNVVDPSIFGFSVPPSKHDVSPDDDDE